MAIPHPTQLKAPRAISFSAWKSALMAAQLPLGPRWQFETEISRFLRYCEVLAAPVIAPRSREYVSRVPLVASRPIARAALRWFFKAAREAERAEEKAAPNCGAADPAATVFPILIGR